MTKSSIEKEFDKVADRLRFFANSHDRGVVIGCFLSFMPLFPISSIGLIISLINLSLARRGKLESFEVPVIKRSIFAGVIMTAIGISFLALSVSIINPPGIFNFFFGWIVDFLNMVLPGIGKESLSDGYSA